MIYLIFENRRKGECIYSNTQGEDTIMNLTNRKRTFIFMNLIISGIGISALVLAVLAIWGTRGSNA
jgi:hypothetical protein